RRVGLQQREDARTPNPARVAALPFGHGLVVQTSKGAGLVGVDVREQPVNGPVEEITSTWQPSASMRSSWASRSYHSGEWCTEVPRARLRPSSTSCGYQWKWQSNRRLARLIADI